MNKSMAAILSLLLISTSACAESEKTYTAPASGPQDVIAAEFCAGVQQSMVNTSLPVDNVIHADYDSFVKSKPEIEPLTSHQYVHYLPLAVRGQPEDFPAIVSCKLKTADLIGDTYGEDKAGEERSCKHIVEQTLAQVVSALDVNTAVFKPEAVVVEDDEVVRMGPKWLKPWPYPVAFIGEQGGLHLRSKALLVPFSVFIPMPDRFKGTHYCHLPTPQYLRAIMSGDIVVSAGE